MLFNAINSLEVLIDSVALQWGTRQRGFGVAILLQYFLMLASLCQTPLLWCFSFDKIDILKLYNNFIFQILTQF